MMICGTTKQPSGLWDAPASRASRRERLERAVEQSFFRHPVLMLTASMLVMGRWNAAGGGSLYADSGAPVGPAAWLVLR